LSFTLVIYILSNALNNIGVFSIFFEVQTPLVVEFYEVIYVMEETQKMGLTNVWLKCYSALVCAAFTTRTNVPWMLQNR